MKCQMLPTCCQLHAAQALVQGYVPQHKVLQPRCASQVRVCTKHTRSDQVPTGALQRWAAIAVALQFTLLPAGPALAQLDTNTSKAGVSAKVEYSDLKSEEGAQALDKLVQQLIPQAEAAIDKMDVGDKVTTAKQELGKVKEVARNLQQRASKGATQSEIRSGVSGTEQQLNALKAIVGLN